MLVKGATGEKSLPEPVINQLMDTYVPLQVSMNWLYIKIGLYDSLVPNRQ